MDNPEIITPEVLEKRLEHVLLLLRMTENDLLNNPTLVNSKSIRPLCKNISEINEQKVALTRTLARFM